GPRPRQGLSRDHQRRVFHCWPARSQLTRQKLKSRFGGNLVRYTLGLLWCYGAAATYAQPLNLKQTIALPGVEGRIDHFAFDPISERLFVCALGNNSVEVVDLHKGQRIHSITGLGAPQGVAYVSGLDRLLVANDDRGICKIYDGK